MNLVVRAVRRSLLELFAWPFGLSAFQKLKVSVALGVAAIPEGSTSKKAVWRA
jgi:hypothetical protein